MHFIHMHGADGRPANMFDGKGVIDAFQESPLCRNSN